MLRVVLADDEKKVLLLMCKLIDWEVLALRLSAWQATVCMRLR